MAAAMLCSPSHPSFCLTVGRIEEIIRDGDGHLYPNGVNSMTLVQKHPDLAAAPGFLVGPNNDQLPGPWRQTRVCCNDGAPPPYRATVNFIWNIVRVHGQAANFMFAGADLMNRMSTFATAFWNAFGPALDPSWDACVALLRQRWNGQLSHRNKMRGTLLNMLIRDEFLTQAMVATGGPFPVIPARTFAYASLVQRPEGYAPPRRQMGNIRANPTTSYVYAREHEMRRVRRRKHRTVFYHGQTHRLLDLTRTQCALLDVNDDPPFNMVVGVGWLWAATQP